MTNNMIRNSLAAAAAACVGLLAGLSSAAHAAAAAGDAAAWRQPPGVADAKTYAFTSTERLLAFMEKRAPGWTGVGASTASGTARALTVSARGTVQRRLHVFALLSANAASDQDDAVRKLVAAVQRSPAPPSGAAQSIAAVEARPARYATLSAALPEGAEAGYVLYWSGQSAFGETNSDVWADRPVAALVAAARNWPSWLYVYAVGLDGVARLVRGGGRLVVLEHSIERPLASATQGRGQ